MSHTLYSTRVLDCGVWICRLAPCIRRRFSAHKSSLWLFWHGEWLFGYTIFRRRSEICGCSVFFHLVVGRVVSWGCGGMAMFKWGARKLVGLKTCLRHHVWYIE